MISNEWEKFSAVVASTIINEGLSDVQTVKLIIAVRH